MATFYITSLLFVLLVLGLVMRWTGLGILKFLRYLREEILIVLGTSSSESALPLLMRKLERLGCPESVVGLLVPMGYSFNLDGTSIYLTLATLFIAQATNTHVTLAQELEILAVLLLTSKGAAAVTGGGFITLAATLSAVGNIPVAGLALLLGIDRFMSEARAITNLIGNGVATVVVSRWEGELDLERARRVLDGVEEVEEAEHAEGRAVAYSDLAPQPSAPSGCSAAASSPWMAGRMRSTSTHSTAARISAAASGSANSPSSSRAASSRGGRLATIPSSR